MLPREQEELAVSCILCEVGICTNPDHGVVRTFDPGAHKIRGSLQPQSPEPQMMRIFDIRGLSFPSKSPSASVFPGDKPTPQSSSMAYLSGTICV